MSPELGRAWFRIALALIAVSGLVLLFQRPGTAEFVVATCSLGVGLIMLLLVTLAVKIL